MAPKALRKEKRGGKADQIVFRVEPHDRKRLELAQVERGDPALSETVRAFIRDGLKKHERKRAA